MTVSDASAAPDATGAIERSTTSSGTRGRTASWTRTVSPGSAARLRRPFHVLAFRVAPPGYVLDWHCAPRRQYSITLSGQAEIEVGDGTVVRVGPGDVLLAEDLTGRGHVTRGVGTTPRFYAIVPLA